MRERTFFTLPIDPWVGAGPLELQATIFEDDGLIPRSVLRCDDLISSDPPVLFDEIDTVADLGVLRNDNRHALHDGISQR